MSFRPGVRLALDWGKARIGVAACDAAGVLAYPVTTVAGGPRTQAELQALVEEHEPIEVVVGLPTSLRGREEEAARTIREHASTLAARIAPTPVRLVDERMTTVTAARQLHERGRSSRQQRAVIDQAAAVAILNHAIESERAGNQPPGQLLEDDR